MPEQLNFIFPDNKHRPKSATSHAKVRAIKCDIELGEPYKVIAKKYKVSMATISRIKNGKFHKNVIATM